MVSSPDWQTESRWHHFAAKPTKIHVMSSPLRQNQSVNIQSRFLKKNLRLTCENSDMSEIRGIKGKCRFLVTRDRIKSAFITYNCFFFREEISGKKLERKKHRITAFSVQGFHSVVWINKGLKLKKKNRLKCDCYRGSLIKELLKLHVTLWERLRNAGKQLCTDSPRNVDDKSRIIEIKNLNSPFSIVVLYWLRDVSIQF